MAKKTEEENLEAAMSLLKRFVQALEMIAEAAQDGKLAPVVNVSVVDGKVIP